jgi:hypothetical protein
MYLKKYINVVHAAVRSGISMGVADGQPSSAKTELLHSTRAFETLVDDIRMPMRR